MEQNKVLNNNTIPNPIFPNSEITRKNEVISQEICHEFIKISKGILLKTRRMLVRLKQSLLERVRLHKLVLDGIDPYEHQLKIDEIFVQCIKDLQNGYLEQKDKMIVQALKIRGQSPKEPEMYTPGQCQNEKGANEQIDLEKHINTEDIADEKVQKKITNINCASFEELLQNDVYREEIIEIEKECKFHLDLFSQDFKPLLKNLQRDIHLVLHDKKQENKGENQPQSVLAAESYHSLSSFKCNQDQDGTINQDLLLKLKKDEQKNINSSIFDLFSQKELEEGKSGALLLSLLEIGNTIDGVIIGNKLLDRQSNLQKQENTLSQSHKHNFSVFLDWKQRQCHGCMEFIIEAGKAVSCVNLIREQNPCTKLFCQSCIIQSMELKEPKPEQSSIFSISQSKRQKLWFKACQNILFMCPCCQNQESCFKLQWSVCSVQSQLEKRPHDFIHRTIYWYRSGTPKQRFVLAKIKGYNRIKKHFKLEIQQDPQSTIHQTALQPLQNIDIAQDQVKENEIDTLDLQPNENLKDSSSPQYSIQIQKEKFFFLESIKNSSKLYGEIQKDKYSIDIKKKIKVQIDDFQNYGDPMFGDYQILEKYANYLEKSDQFQVFPMPIERRLKYDECDDMVAILLKKEEDNMKASEEHNIKEQLLVVHEEEEQAAFLDNKFKSENLSAYQELEINESVNIKKSAMSIRKDSSYFNMMEEKPFERQQIIQDADQQVEQDPEVIQHTTDFQYDIKIEDLEEIDQPEQPENNIENIKVKQNESFQSEIHEEQQSQELKDKQEPKEKREQIQIEDIEIKEETTPENENKQESKLPPEIEIIEQAIQQENQFGDKNLRPRRQINRGDFQDYRELIYQQAIPSIIDDQLDDINRQLERQFKKIDELKKNKGKFKSTNYLKFDPQEKIDYDQVENKGDFTRDLINFEERKREEEIEKRIDRLLKRKDELANKINKRNKIQHIQSQINDDDEQIEKTQQLPSANNLMALNFEDFKQFEMQIHHKKGKQTQTNSFFMEVKDEINFSRKHDDKYYLRRFKQCIELKLHCKLMKQLAQKKPIKLIGLYVYVQCSNTEKDLWYRALIKDYDPQGYIFSIEHQNETKIKNNVKFAINSESKTDTNTEKNVLSFMIDYNLKNEQDPTEKYINFNDAKVLEWLQQKQNRMSKIEYQNAIDQLKQLRQQSQEQQQEGQQASQNSEIEPNAKRQKVQTSQVDINRNLQEIVNEIVDNRVEQSDQKKYEYSKKSEIDNSINECKVEKQKSTNSKELKPAAPLSRYMIKKYSNMLDKEFSITNRAADERKGKQGGATADKHKPTIVAPKSLIFKANFDCSNQKVEELKDHWVTNMKERNLRTKVKNKETLAVDLDKNSNVKLLKFYHQEIDEDQISNNSINISNKNEITDLIKQYQSIKHPKKNKLLIQLTDKNNKDVKVTNTKVSIPNSQADEGESGPNQHQQINKLLEKINVNNQQEMLIMQINQRQFNQQKIREAFINKNDFGIPGFNNMGMQAMVGHQGFGLQAYDGFNQNAAMYPNNQKLFDIINNPLQAQNAGALMNPNQMMQAPSITQNDLFQQQQFRLQQQQAMQEAAAQSQNPLDQKQQLDIKNQKTPQDDSSNKRLVLRVQFDKEKKANDQAEENQQIQEQQQLAYDGELLPAAEQMAVAEVQVEERQQNMYQVSQSQEVVNNVQMKEEQVEGGIVQQNIQTESQNQAQHQDPQTLQPIQQTPIKQPSHHIKPTPHPIITQPPPTFHAAPAYSAPAQLRGDFIIPQGAQGSQGMSRFQPSHRPQNQTDANNAQYQEEVIQDGVQQEGNDANDVMAQFYQQYIQQGFRKCSCQVCVAMMYPVLIRRDADSNDFVSEHGKYCELLGYERGQIRQDQMNVNENGIMMNEEMNMNQAGQMQPRAPHTQVNFAEDMNNVVSGQQNDMQQVQYPQQLPKNNDQVPNFSGAYELHQPPQLAAPENQNVEANNQFANHQMPNQFQTLQQPYQSNNQEQMAQQQYEQQQYQHNLAQQQDFPQQQQMQMGQIENLKERNQMMGAHPPFEAGHSNERYQHLQQQNRNYQGSHRYGGGPMYVLNMPEQQANRKSHQIPQYNGASMPMYQQEFYDQSQYMNQGAGSASRVFYPSKQVIQTSLFNTYHMNKMIYDRELQDLDYIRGKYIELHTKNQQFVMVPNYSQIEKRGMQNQLQHYQQEIKRREQKINEMYQELSSLRQTLAAQGDVQTTPPPQGGYTLAPAVLPNNQQQRDHQPDSQPQVSRPPSLNPNNHT